MVFVNSRPFVRTRLEIHLWTNCNEDIQPPNTYSIICRRRGSTKMKEYLNEFSRASQGTEWTTLDGVCDETKWRRETMRAKSEAERTQKFLERRQPSVKISCLTQWVRLFKELLSVFIKNIPFASFAVFCAAVVFRFPIYIFFSLISYWELSRRLRSPFLSVLYGISPFSLLSSSSEKAFENQTPLVFLCFRTRVQPFWVWSILLRRPTLSEFPPRRPQRIRHSQAKVLFSNRPSMIDWQVDRDSAELNNSLKRWSHVLILFRLIPTFWWN